MTTRFDRPAASALAMAVGTAAGGVLVQWSGLFWWGVAFNQVLPVQPENISRTDC